MFCPECMENDLHGIVCGISQHMMVSRGLYPIIMIKNPFKTADEMISFVEDIVNRGVQQSPPPLLDAQSKYRAFFQSGLITYLIYRLLLTTKEMTSFFNTKPHKRFLMHLINHHVVLTEDRHHHISKENGRGVTFYFNIVAYYFNHSCFPNVCISQKNGIVSCTVIRPIQKDEQLLLSYVPGGYYCKKCGQNCWWN